MSKQFNTLPLRIYLDTSDYSRFADIGYRNDVGVSDTLDFLRAKKDQKIIDVVFSGVHLFEFLKDPSQRSLALRKVQVIEELCGDHAFRFFGDVFGREIEAFRSGTDPASVVISDEGEWMPFITPPASSFDRESLVRIVQENLPQLDAAEIRALMADPGAAAFLNEKMSGQFPLANVYDSDLTERFLAGDISGELMSRTLVKERLRPRTFIEHYLADDPESQKFFGVLATEERTLCQNLVEIQNDLKNRLERASAIDPGVIKEVRKQVKPPRLHSTWLHRDLNDLPPNFVEAIGKRQYLKELPALSTHYNVFAAYIDDIFQPTFTAPEIKESDAGDILHAVYLPFVDFFRTDGRFGAILNRVPKPSTVKVVPKLSQLREAIERELESRAEDVRGGIGSARC